MPQPQEINIRQLLDRSPISFYQKLIIALCFFIVVADGFDVAIMGFVAPYIKADWQLTNNALAPVLSAALAGLAVGAMITGPLADKFGRRKVLLGNVLCFGCATLLVAHAGDIWQLVVFRFIAGCAMGGIMPNAATLVTEFSPARKRAFLITIVFAGFTVGAAGGGFLAAWLIPHYGWHSVFYVGGITPLVLSVIMFFRLPESIGFLIHKRGDQAQIRALVERCVPHSTTEHSVFVLPHHTLPSEAEAAASNESPVQTVLNAHYRAGSLLLWLAYFSHLFLVYLLGSWMPTMIKESGMTAEQASIISAMFQLGGPLGSVAVGWLMDRFNAGKTVADVPARLPAGRVAQRRRHRHERAVQHVLPAESARHGQRLDARHRAHRRVCLRLCGRMVFKLGLGFQNRRHRAHHPRTAGGHRVVEQRMDLSQARQISPV